MLRRFFTLVLVGGVLFAAVGGGWLVAGGPMRGTADAPLTVDAGTAAELGFGEPTVEPVQFQERLQVAGVEKAVDLSAYVMTTSHEETGAAVVTVSLPAWRVGGVPLNPLAYAPLKQAVTHVLPYLPMETPEVTWTGETTVELAGGEVTAGEYEIEGDAPRLVVARETMDEDTVFAVGVYSPARPESRDAVDALFAALSHG